MDKNIPIQVQKRMAWTGWPGYIVCGNDGYTITFDFDDEWDEAAAKTARFKFRTEKGMAHTDQPFTGNTVKVPMLSNIREVEVGVFVGDLTTTTGATIRCVPSIRCDSGEATEYEKERFDELMQLFNELLHEHNNKKTLDGFYCESLETGFATDVSSTELKWRGKPIAFDFAGSKVSMVQEVEKNGKRYYRLWFTHGSFTITNVPDYIDLPIDTLNNVTEESGNITLNGAVLDFGFTGGSGGSGGGVDFAKSRGKVELFVETYYKGGNQPYHPSVVAFDSAWNGYKYWMAYTPLPFGNEDEENPCVACSNDLIKWVTPKGLINPLDDISDGSQTYWSDTELFYNSDTQKLECWYRGYKNNVVTIARKTSSNGVTWSAREIIQTFNGTSGYVCPTVIYENSKYHIWLLSPYYYYETSDPTNWGSATTYTMDGVSNYWHGQVKKTSKGYEYVVMKTWGNHYTIDYLVSDDGISFKLVGTIVKSHKEQKIPYGIDSQGLYRPCFIVVNGWYYMFYSTISENNRKGITLSVGKSLSDLVGISAEKIPLMAKPTKISRYGHEKMVFDENLKAMCVCSNPITEKFGECEWLNLSTGEMVSGDNVAIPITGLSLKSAYTMYLGTPSTISVTYIPSNTTQRSLIWESNDTTIATVNEFGVITPVAEGSCTITCISKENAEISAYTTLTIKNAEEIPQEKDLLAGVSLSENTRITAKGAVQSIDAYNLSDYVDIEFFDYIVFNKTRWDICCFFDVEQQYISGASYSGDIENFKVPIPSNAKYVRFNIYKQWADEIIVTAYRVAEESMLSNATWENGYISSTGVLTSSAYAATSSYIAVNGGENYTIVDNTNGYFSAIRVNEYDANNVFLKREMYNTSVVEFQTSTDTKFVRIGGDVKSELGLALDTHRLRYLTLDSVNSEVTL